MPRVQIVYAERYEYTHKTTGNPVSGVQITILQPTDNDPNRKGLEVAKIRGPHSLWKDITEVPGHYDIELSIRPDFNDQPVARLTAITPAK